jgi:hypothetical protein
LLRRLLLRGCWHCAAVGTVDHQAETTKTTGASAAFNCNEIILSTVSKPRCGGRALRVAGAPEACDCPPRCALP